MTNLDLFAPITKSEKLDDGSMLVYGKITGPDLDLDGQRCDPAWLAKAVPDWMNIGNLRLMHQPVAIGKALEHEQDGDDHYITAKVVDPAAVKLVDEGVLTGFSVGIKSPRLRKDASAPNGLIYGGKIVETSLVDAPCNETCKLVLAKAVSTELPELTVEDLQPVDEPVLEKRDFSTDERSHLAGTGDALPDGSFPIQNRDDLKNAVQAYGRAKDKEAAKKHIISRAHSLGFSDLLPHDWINSNTKDAEPEITKDLTGDDQGQDDACGQARKALQQILAMEANEVKDGEGSTGPVKIITQLLDLLDCYEQSDAWDDETFAQAKAVLVNGGPVATLPDLVKAVTADDADEDQIAELRKALFPDLVTKIETFETKAATLDELVERVSVIEKQPDTGGPARLRPPADAKKAAERDGWLAKAAHFEQMADTVTNPDQSWAYKQLAADARAKAA